MTPAPLVAGLALLFAAAPALAQADAYSPDNFLLGDLGGVRTKLHDAGVDVRAGYVNELAGNVQGGARRTATYADQWMVGLDLDLARLVGIRGGSLHGTLINRSGRDLNGEAGLNTLLSPQEIYGYGTRNRIVELYYQQMLFGDRLSLKIGRMPESGDIFPFSCKFQSLVFCGTVPGYITPNWYTYPVSQWGASAHAKIGRRFEVQASIYRVNPTLTLETEGLDLGNPGHSTGYLAVGEVTWKPVIAGRPGKYLVGVWRNSGNFSDVYANQAGQPLGLAGGTPRALGHASSYYLMAQQQLSAPRPDGRGISAFANFIRSDDRVSYIESLAEGGLFWTGPFAARPKDEIGFAIGRLKVNELSAQRIAQQNAGLPAGTAPAGIPHVEYPMELYYGFAVSPAITTRPNIQYVVDPGGIGGARNVVTLGLKTSIAF